MKLLDIAFKDMTRSFRSANALMFMFVIPLLVSGMFAFMFGNLVHGGKFNLPRTRLVVANIDHNAPRLQGGSNNIPGSLHANSLAELVVAVLQSEDMTDLLEVSLVPDADTARAKVDNRQAQVAVIIPADFSRQFADLNRQAELEFYQDPTLTIGPEVIRSILSQFMDSLAGVKIAADLAIDASLDQDYSLVGQVIQRYLEITQLGEDPGKDLLDIHAPPSTQANDNPLARIIAPIMGGMMIFYAFYTGTASAESILTEEEERTLQRLFTTPTPQSTILSGKLLAVFLTVIVQMSVLLAASHLLFGIFWGQLVPVGLVVIGTVCSSSSMGIFINSLLRDSKQGGVVFGGVLTLTGMIGMVRIFAMGAPFASGLGEMVSLIVPQGWAVRGLLQAMSAEPPGNVLLTALVMLVWSLVFFISGVQRFNRRYA
jgi:ABC-2 type transport system permease protein